MPKSPAQDNRPVCGLCLVRKEIRPRMYAVPGRPGAYRCPVCHGLTVNPTDADRTAEDVAIMFKEGAEETKRRAEAQLREYNSKPHTHSGGPIVFKGESKGRRRKAKRKPSPWYNGTFDRPERPTGNST